MPITWFLLNEDSEQLIAQGKASLDFRYPFENCLTTNPTTPEEAMCYRQEFVLDLYDKVGFAVKQPIHFGRWCGRQSYLSAQDICIADKLPAVGNIDAQAGIAAGPAKAAQRLQSAYPSGPSSAEGPMPTAR
jgi:hypothetical protein